MNLFEDFHNQAAEQAQHSERQQEFDRLLVRLLASPPGRRFMEILEQNYIARPSYQPGMDPQHVAWAEGRRSILIELKTRFTRLTRD